MSPDIIGWYLMTPGPMPELRFACKDCMPKMPGDWRPAYSTSDYPGLSKPECSYCGTDVGRDSGERVGQRELSEASRYTDARAEDIGFEETVNELGIEMSGLMYVAEQRALRMILIMQGRSPSEMSKTSFERISLSSNERKMMALFQSCWIDALCVGVKTMKIREGAGADGN